MTSKEVKDEILDNVRISNGAHAWLDSELDRLREAAYKEGYNRAAADEYERGFNAGVASGAAQLTRMLGAR